MFGIGDFAKLGRVSVRMLRHYDAIGLLIPAVVDPASGYRYYGADQLSRLNRVIALKDLGFTLRQVQAIVDEEVDVAELRGMLRLRRAQLEARMAADVARLTGVAARLRTIEREGNMNTEDVVLKQIPAVRVAELSAVAGGYGPEHISPVIQPMYGELARRLAAAGITPTGPAIAYYEPEAVASGASAASGAGAASGDGVGAGAAGPAGRSAQPGRSAGPAESGRSGDGDGGDGGDGDGDGETVTVHAGMTVATGAHPDHDFTVVDLPAVASAATVVHRGSMDDVMQSLQILARWIEDNGYRPVGYHREVYLDYCPDQPDRGVTELQIEVVRA